MEGSGYIFRAYHALPPLNRKSDGLQVNAVLGFCNMLWKLMRDMPPDNRPTHLAIIFDKSEVTFRNKLYPEYKAQRPPAPAAAVAPAPPARRAPPRRPVAAARPSSSIASTASRRPPSDGSRPSVPRRHSPAPMPRRSGPYLAT